MNENELHEMTNLSPIGTYYLGYSPGTLTKKPKRVLYRVVDHQKARLTDENKQHFVSGMIEVLDPVVEIEQTNRIKNTDLRSITEESAKMFMSVARQYERMK